MIFYTNMQLIPKITFKYFCLEEKQNKWIVGQFVKIKLRDSFLCALLLHLKWIPIIPTFKKWSSTCSYPKTSETYKTQKKRTLGSNNFYRLSLLFSQTTKVDSNLVRMIHALWMRKLHFWTSDPVHKCDSFNVATHILGWC